MLAFITMPKCILQDHGIELTGEVKVNLAKWLLASKQSIKHQVE
jgi:hypothetical protein